MGLVYLPALGVVDRLFQAYPDTTHGTAIGLPINWGGLGGQRGGIYGSPMGSPMECMAVPR